MITIYHNPRCSKSREGVCYLEEHNIEFNTVKYLDESLTEKELKDIINILKIKPIELMRTKETIWKEQFANKELSDEEIIRVMVENPKLIERPIVINGNKGVIARPTEKIATIL